MTVASVQEKLASASVRLAAVEKALVERDNVNRVTEHLSAAKLASVFLKTAPADYYSWTLAQRG